MNTPYFQRVHFPHKMVINNIIQKFVSKVYQNLNALARGAVGYRQRINSMSG